MNLDKPPAHQRDPFGSSPEDSAPEGTARRVLDALRRSAVRARRVAAQTGTRLVVVRDGELVIEAVESPRPETPSDS